MKGVKDLLLEEREGKLKVTQAILYSEVKVQEKVLRKALWMVHQGLVEIVMVLRMEIVDGGGKGAWKDLRWGLAGMEGAPAEGPAVGACGGGGGKGAPAEGPAVGGCGGGGGKGAPAEGPEVGEGLAVA